MAALTAGLEKEILAKTTVAAKAAEKAAIIRPSVDTKNAEGKIVGLAQGIESKFKDVGVNIGKSLSQGLSSVGQGAGIGPIGAVTAGLAIVGTAIAAFAVEGVKNFAAVTAQVSQFQRVTNLSAEESSRFVGVLKALGIEPSTAARAFSRLAINIEQNPKKLEDLGVAIAKNKNGTTDLIGTVGNLSDAYQKSGDSAQKAAIAQLLSQRAALQLGPLLATSRKELEALSRAIPKAEIFNQQDLRTGLEFRVTTRELKESMEGLTIAVGRGLVPALTALIGAVKPVINIFSDELTSSIHAVGAAIDFVTGKHHDHAHSAHDDAVALEEFKQQTKEAKLALDEQNKGVTDLKSSAISAASAQRSYDAALRGVTSASQGVKAAQDTLNDLLKKGAVDAKAVAAAHRSVEDSTRGLERAERTLSQAWETLNNLQNQGAVDAKAVISAQQSLTQTIRSRESAIAALAAAENHLTEIQRGPTPRKLEEAQLRVRTATNALARSEATLAADRKDHTKTALDLSDAQNVVEQDTLNLQQAQEDLTAVEKIGTEGSQELIQARQDVATATDAVVTATEANQTAAVNLAKAQAGDPDFQDKLATARQGVADATQAQRRAADDLVTANSNLATAQAGDPEFQDKVATARQGVATATQNVADAGNNAASAANALFEANQKVTTVLDANAQFLPILSTQLGVLATQFPVVAPLLTQIQSILGLSATTAAFTFGSGSGGGGTVRSFDTGGTVPGPRGEPRLIIAHGGEEVFNPFAGPSRTITTGTVIQIEAHFGPGSNAEDFWRGMEQIAQSRVDAFAAKVTSGRIAGVGTR